MITLAIFGKFLLAMLITAVPVFFRFYIKPKSKSEKDWKNIFTWLETKSEFFAKIKKKSRAIAKSFFEGMKYNKKIRKFYILLMVITMLLVEIADLKMSQTIATFVLKYTGGSQIKAFDIDYLYPLLTNTFSTVTAFLMSIVLLSYRFANFILTKLHDNLYVFIFTSLLAVGLGLLCDGRMILLALTLLIILNTACYYPDMDKE